MHACKLYANNEQYTPFGYGTIPNISIVSPENKTYTVKDVPLTFTVNKPTSWIGYSLDGQANVTITGNTTLSGLPDGSHSLTVYAKDTAGNTEASETIYFSIEPFPITWIAAATAIIAIGGAAFLVYFGKIKKTSQKSNNSRVSHMDINATHTHSAYGCCSHCGFVLPKKDAIISGWDSQSSLRHIHCPKCGKIITHSP